MEACIKADENKEKMKRLEENFAAKLEEVAARVEEVKLEMEKEGFTRVKEAQEYATIQIKKELTTARLQDWDYDPAEQRYCICNQVFYGICFCICLGSL